MSTMNLLYELRSVIRQEVHRGSKKCDPVVKADDRHVHDDVFDVGTAGISFEQYYVTTTTN